MKSKQSDNEEMSPDENERAADVQPSVATLIVRVPVDARVYLDGRRTRSANQGSGFVSAETKPDPLFFSLYFPIRFIKWA
jgi:hypothetical protein